MILKINQKQIESVLKLDAPQRYAHCLKRIADCEEAWGLYQDGWALAGDEGGNKIFPLWPAEEYAALCAVELWESYKPEPIPLAELTEELLPSLEKEDILLGVFYTPENKGVVVTTEEFVNHLNYELSRY